ncbi:rRNA adenine N(6)-methyltransferase [Sergentomyia squamirostris]
MQPVRKFFHSVCSFNYTWSHLKFCSTNSVQWNSVKVRLSSTAADIATEDSPKKTRKKRKVKSAENDAIPENIIEYFKSKHQSAQLEGFPSDYLIKKQQTPDHLYIVDESVAKTVAGIVCKNSQDDSPIVEINPGLGILTQELLKVSKQKIHLYEVDNEFNGFLEELVKKNRRRLSLRNADLVFLYKLAYQDKLDNGNRVESLLNDKLPKRNWKEAPNARIVGAVGSQNFFRHLVYSVIYQSSLLSYGRSEMFLIVPPPIFIQLTCTKDAGYMTYRYLAVLFQIFFQYELLEKVPRLAFLPWQQKHRNQKYKKLFEVRSCDADYLYLVKVTPRQETYDLCAPDDMEALWFFVKQSMISRTKRIIPSLEKWVPYCGLRLISQKVRAKEFCDEGKPRAKLPSFVQPCRPISCQDYPSNINIFTQFGDLTPSEMLSLFHQFRNWPEYKHSPFLPLMEKSLLKMFTQEDKTTDADTSSSEKPDKNDDKDQSVALQTSTHGKNA